VHFVAGVAVIAGTFPMSFDVAVTVKLDLTPAVAGAPVKLTVGVISFAAIVRVSVLAAYIKFSAQAADSLHEPVPLVIVTLPVTVTPRVDTLLRRHGPDM
jgi:hypothetical protein